MDQATVYADNAAAQARTWQDAGLTWLHVVDLNGAFAGRPVNTTAVNASLRAIQIPVQLGGGIRDMVGIEAWLAAGVCRVVPGSAAAKNSVARIEGLPRLSESHRRRHPRTRRPGCY
jgi:phosphoribosylformimino-5-aminoimidazole carboxamide ribotide isomerase